MGERALPSHEAARAAAATAGGLRVVLTFDVEERFRSEAAAGLRVAPLPQAGYAARVATATDRVLRQLAGHGARATYFVLQQVAAEAVGLRTLRRKVMGVNGSGPRELDRTLELPGKSPLRDAHDALDAAVRPAYGVAADEDPRAFLLALNGTVAAREAAAEPATAPGLPPCVEAPAPCITDDCVKPPALYSRGAAVRTGVIMSFGQHPRHHVA
jgi:hypothetical protein